MQTNWENIAGLYDYTAFGGAEVLVSHNERSNRLSFTFSNENLRLSISINEDGELLMMQAQK